MFRQVARRAFHTARQLRAEGAGGRKGILNLQFSTPNDVLFNNVEISRITVPAVTGDMGILADHAPSLCQLRPGVVEVVQADGATKKWFVPGGFAIITPDSTCSLTAVEAIPTEDVDVAKANEELSKATAAEAAAKDDNERVEHRISMEVFAAMAKVTA